MYMYMYILYMYTEDGAFSQLTFAFSKSTIETLQKGVKHMFRVNNKNTRTTSLMLFIFSSFF